MVYEPLYMQLKCFHIGGSYIIHKIYKQLNIIKVRFYCQIPKNSIRRATVKPVCHFQI